VKPDLKKSATYKNGREDPSAHNQQVEEKASKEDAGWRTRDALVVAHDDLFRRVENFIKKQHDNLRLQRQESEDRHFLEFFCK
jgi:ATP sulfurylase